VKGQVRVPESRAERRARMRRDRGWQDR